MIDLASYSKQVVNNDSRYGHLDDNIDADGSFLTEDPGNDANNTVKAKKDRQ